MSDFDVCEKMSDVDDTTGKNNRLSHPKLNLNYFAADVGKIDSHVLNSIKLIDLLNELQLGDVNEVIGWRYHFENFSHPHTYPVDAKELLECFEWIVYRQLQDMNQNWFVGDFIVELKNIPELAKLPFSYISEKFVRSPYDEYNESFVNVVLGAFDRVSNGHEVLFGGLIKKNKDDKNRMKWLKHLMKHKNLIRNTTFTSKECVSNRLKPFLDDPYNLWYVFFAENGVCPPFLEAILDLMGSDIPKEDVGIATLFIQQEICENPLPILISLISLKVGNLDSNQLSLIRDTIWSLLQNSSAYVKCFKEILSNKPPNFTDYANIKPLILDVIDEEYMDLISRQDDKEESYSRLIFFLTETNIVDDFLKNTSNCQLMFKILSDESNRKLINIKSFVEFRVKNNPETFIPAILEFVKNKLISQLYAHSDLWLLLRKDPTQQHLDNLNKHFIEHVNKNSIDWAKNILATLLKAGSKTLSAHKQYSDWKDDKIVFPTEVLEPKMEQVPAEAEENIVENFVEPIVCDEYYMFLESNIFAHESDEVNEAVGRTVEKLSQLLQSDSNEEKEFANSTISRCMNREMVDRIMYDQLYAVGKLLLAFEKIKWITLEKLLEFCYDLFSKPGQISYAIVDVILYEVKGRLHEHKDLCSKFTSCIYFAELTPLLTVYLEFAAIGESTHLDITAFDPVPILYNSPECVKIIAQKALNYGPSISELNQFCNVDIGRVIVHVNDCNMKTQLLIADRMRVEELPNDVKNDVRFILNSSTMINIQQKSQEIANRVQFHHYTALSNFLVSAISSGSVNVDVVSSIWLRLELSIFYPTFISDFCHLVKKSFFLCCERPESTQTFFILGNVLGEITLNRNVPIADSNIDLKYLLIEAYFKRTTLHHALVFVSRTLIRAKQSQFFRTFNYYVLQLLSLMKEIYIRLSVVGQTQIPLEIEQTFNELSLDIKAVRPSSYLSHPAYITILPLVFQWSDMEALQLLHDYIHLTGFNHVVTPSVYQCIKYRDIEHVDVSRMLAFFNISFNSAAPRALSAKVAIHFAIERTYNEYARSVSERVSRGCLSLCETIILKDFPQDKYDDMMRRSVIDMARSIATSYSYTTLHGNLYPNLYKSFRQNIHEILASTSHQNANSSVYDVAECSDSLAADNIDLLINLIQKFCGEKLLAELVRRISVILESRCNCAPVEKSMRLAAYGDTQKHLPAKLKVNFSSLSIEHKACYTKFVNYQPGFMPDICTMDHLLESVVVVSNDKRDQLELISINLEQLIEALKSSINPPTDEHLVVELSTLKEMIKYLLESRLGRVIVAIIKHLIMTNFYLFGICLNSQVAIPLRVIVYFREILDVFRYWEGIGPYRLAKFVTRVVMEVPQTLQFSNETVFHLVRNYLIIVPDYDIFLAKCIDNAKNGSALKFAMLFCKTFLITEKQYNITNDHLKLTLSTLQYLTTVKNDTTVLNLEEHLKPPFNFPTKTMDPSIILPGIDFQSFSSQLENIKTVIERDSYMDNLFVTWLTHYYDDPIRLLDPNYISAVRRAFEHAGFKPNTEYWKEFTKCTLKYGFKECLKEEADNKFVCKVCDSMAGFCSLLVKSLYEFTNIGNVAAITHLFVEIGNCLMFIIDCCSDVTKISIVRRFLSNFCVELRRPFLNEEGEFTKERLKEVKNSPLHPISINNSEPNSTTDNQATKNLQQKDTKTTVDDNCVKIKSSSMHGLLQLMYSFASLLHGIRPTRFPKFAAHWQKVVISSNVIPTLITGGIDKSGWLICNNIIVDALLFLGAIIRQGVLAPHRVRYFEESLGLFHSLKEDFPQVISQYALMYVELLPINAIQMRNAFLCASPVRANLMPNPFKHRLLEITEYELHKPEVVYDALICFETKPFRDELLKYFISGADDKVLDRLFDLLTKSTHNNGKDFYLNTVALNSVIFLCAYFGSRNDSNEALTRENLPTVESVQEGIPFYLIMYLLSAFDPRGQYSVICAMANHLRYPNAHTHFFKCVFIAIAACLSDDKDDDDSDNIVLQLIIRTLTERLLPKPPHPWGIISTLAELLIDPNIDLISKSFVTENKDIFALLNGIREKALE